ncbi:MAG TPA: aspartyl/asparaginyl beta-hydroxylase domain-containing protein [Rhodanobacteraceae bacterium]|nr:aspartyl/asparaginyl beta-hydroxylase domain-containing protein [Rhodanobacteraceae bacterium]
MNDPTMAGLPADTIAARRNAARALVQQGRIDQAEPLFAEVLRGQPDDIEALNFLAMCARGRGQSAQATELLERALGIEADYPVTLQSLGMIYQETGRLDEALEMLRRALRRTPESYVGRLHLAQVLEQLGQADQALSMYFGAITMAQGQGRWLSDETTGVSLRPLVKHAMRAVAAGRRRLFMKVIAPLRERYGSTALRRVEKCLSVHLGDLPTETGDPRQKPTFLYFPDLPTRRFFDRDSFPWYEELESHTAAIREELLGLLADAGTLEPYLEFDEARPLEKFLGGSRGTPAWNAFIFYRHGKRYEENCGRCPQTVAALDATSLVRVRDHGPEACFSVLTPGSHILPHHGVTNTRAVTHLPLIVPEDCALLVSGEEHVWQEGRCMTFDDTFEHEAWNRSEHTRVIMLFDVWNPYLDEVERLAIGELVAAIGDFNQASQAV